MPVEFYKSAVAVMVKADDPTQVRVMPVAAVPEYEEWHVHSDVTEIGKDGIPVSSKVQTVALRGPVVRASYAYDVPAAKGEDGMLVSVPSMCLVRVEVAVDAVGDAFDSKTAEKLDTAKMAAMVAEYPLLEARFADQPAVETAEELVP